MSLVIISTHPIQYHAPVYRYLQQHLGVDITVIYGSDQGVTGYRDKEFGVTFAWDTDLLSGYRSIFLSHINPQARLGSNTVSDRCLEETIDRANPTAVLILGYAVQIYQRAWAHAKKRRYSVGFRMETQDELYRKFFLKSAMRDLFLKFIYKHTDAFLYIGKAAHQHYRRLGVPENKLFFSPYAVDINPFQLKESQRNTLRSDKRRELEIRSDDVAILFSGKLIRKKNPSIILQALRILPPDFQRRVVVLYLGDGPLKFLLVKESNKIPSVRVIFCGFKNQTQLSVFYHAADFLVLPSLFNETWGLVVNEALAHGLPCVVSDHVGCYKDLIEPGVNGEVFEGGNENDLASAISRINQYFKFTEVQEACRQRISNYSVSLAAKGIERAYQAVSAQHEKR